MWLYHIENFVEICQVSIEIFMFYRIHFISLPFHRNFSESFQSALIGRWFLT